MLGSPERWQEEGGRMPGGPGTAWVARSKGGFPSPCPCCVPALQGAGQWLFPCPSAPSSDGVFPSQPCSHPQGQVSSSHPVQVTGSLPEAPVPREG